MGPSSGSSVPKEFSFQTEASSEAFPVRMGVTGDKMQNAARPLHRPLGGHRELTSQDPSLVPTAMSM